MRLRLGEQEDDFAVDQRAERVIVLPVEEAGQFQHRDAGERCEALSSGEIEQEAALAVERDRQGIRRTVRPSGVLHPELPCPLVMRVTVI